MKIQGEMNFDAKKGDKFGKLINNRLVGSEDDLMLTNEEIVVYGYMLFDGYSPRTKKTISKRSAWEISVSVGIHIDTVKECFKSLESKKMIKNVPKRGRGSKNDGAIWFEIIGEAFKGNYVMVTKSFLISQQLTTAQKAFLLRLDALRREQLITGNHVTQGRLAALLFISRQSVSSMIKKMLGSSYNVKWIYIEEDTSDVIIDYEILKRSVSEELANEAEKLRKEEKIRLHNIKQNVRYGKTKVTKKRKVLYDKMDRLIEQGKLTIERAKYINNHYIIKGLTSRAEEMLNRYENLV
jgi:ElaB/YqjD/DUF883 family membrane-anchored ribosome-binding protein